MNSRAQNICQLVLGVTLAFGILPFAIYSRDRVTVNSVSAKIKRELMIGASGQEIESFFERHGIGLSRDAPRGRYHGTIRDISPYTFIDKGVSIVIYTDQNNRYVRAEVDLFYTSL